MPGNQLVVEADKANSQVEAGLDMLVMGTLQVTVAAALTGLDMAVVAQLSPYKCYKIQIL